jgi:hypothetical protein
LTLKFNQIFHFTFYYYFMKKKEYMPTADKDKAAWLKNFANKIQGYATTLKISEADLKSVNEDANAFAYILECVELVKTYNLQMTAFKDALRDGSNNNGIAVMPALPKFPTVPTMVDEGIFGRIRKLVQNIKSQKAYTEDIGKALGVIGETTTINYDTLKPELTAMLTGGKVVVKWKKGKADSINIYVKRGAADFVLAGNDAKPPFDDPTPLPSEATTWIYKGMYVINDTEVGQVSNEVSILVQKVV